MTTRRRQDAARMKRKAIKLGRLPKYADHLATCSCQKCGNPRRYFGQPTVQERRHERDADDDSGPQPPEK